MIKISQSFDTRADAEAFKAMMYREYHPCGYGTSLTISETPKGFLVSGFRYRSCD